jgi:hypothetical protein
METRSQILDLFVTLNTPDRVLLLEELILLASKDTLSELTAHENPVLLKSTEALIKEEFFQL